MRGYGDIGKGRGTNKGIRPRGLFPKGDTILKYFKAYIAGCIASVLTACIAGGSFVEKAPPMSADDVSGRRSWSREWSDTASAVGVDRENNIYVSGERYTADGTFGYIRKWSDNGDIVWDKTFPFVDRLFVCDMDIDHNGFIYITGTVFTGLDGLKVKGRNDIFVMKWDREGNKLWTRLWGTPSYETVKKMRVDRKGRINLAGATMSNGDLGVSLALQFSPDGKINRVRLWKLRSESIAYGLAMDDLDNVCVTGTAYGGHAGKNGGRTNDVFLNYITSGGKIIWSRKVDRDGVVDIAYDPGGFFYLFSYSGYQTNNTYGKTIMNHDGEITIIDKQGKITSHHKFARNSNEIFFPTHAVFGYRGNVYCMATIRDPAHDTEDRTHMRLYDDRGKQVKDKRFDQSVSHRMYVTGMVVDTNGHITISGNFQTHEHHYHRKAFLFHLTDF